MNESYAKHIVQKYIIATALAVIRCKPLGQSIEEYLNVLRNKFECREDLLQDITISESDFAICDDEVIADLNNDIVTEEISVIPDDHFNWYDNVCDKLNENLNTENDLNHNNDVAEVKGVNSNINEDVRITHETIARGTTRHLERSTSIKEVVDIFKDIENVFIDTSTPKNAQSTADSTSQKYSAKALTLDNEVTFCSTISRDENDTQNTELYTVYGYTDNFTHISQSQDVNIVVPKNLIQNCSIKSNKEPCNIKDNLQLARSHNRDNAINRDNNNIRTADTNDISRSSMQECQPTNNSGLNSSHTEVMTTSKRRKRKSDIIANKSDEYSDIFIEMLINDSNSKNLEGSRNTNEHLAEMLKEKQFSNLSLLNEIELDSNSFHGGNTVSTKRLIERQTFENVENTLEEIESVVNVDNSYNLSDSQFIFSSVDSQSLLNPNNNTHHNAEDGKLKNNGPTENNCNCVQLSSGYETQCGSRNVILDSPSGERSDADTPEETVTFKILEELNRVKNYLNRQDIRLSDSGRSSQGSQLSGVRINESGYCLLSYLVEYPLIERTLDITEEVSRVLGDFVDRLHDDEIYPQFVEKTLEIVHELVKNIYEDDRTEDLLKKDDQINRLLLLNRSVHVTKFTIDKILPVLQEVHAQLQTRNLLELCPGKTENLCYVLHVLEVLLKRHNAASSQASSQLSQEDDKSLKRSTITEIWRKKWNLSKSDVSEGSFKKCVLAQTGEVLNKIIVAGMDGYSLISFAALQCFNLLQS